MLGAALCARVAILFQLQSTNDFREINLEPGLASSLTPETVFVGSRGLQLPLYTVDIQLHLCFGNIYAICRALSTRTTRTATLDRPAPLHPALLAGEEKGRREIRLILRQHSIS